jgi:hypothetical protein
MRAWPAVVLAPALALADQGAAYVLVAWSCAAQDRVWLNLVHVVFLGAVVATLALAARALRRAHPRVPADEGESGERRHFFALVGVLLAALSAAAIVAMWIPQAFLSPCLA